MFILNTVFHPNLIVEGCLTTFGGLLHTLGQRIFFQLILPCGPLYANPPQLFALGGRLTSSSELLFKKMYKICTKQGFFRLYKKRAYSFWLQTLEIHGAEGRN